MRMLPAVAVTVVLLVATPGAAAEEPSLAPDQAYVTCMREAARTPDALEHWVDHCRLREAVTVSLDKTSETCLRAAVGTADARERWADVCRNRADRATASGG